MNKTVNINLGGLPFIMDEEAYERLQQYIAALHRHFANTEGHEEIMQDIESRIAEILSMRLNAAKKIITVADVEEVVTIIGKPEDMGGSDTANANAGAGSQHYTYTRRRLYRDKDNQVIGGVCAGLGAFFDIDPVWIRLIWAVSFFIFGVGFLLYILMWIIIPEAKTPAQKLEMRGDNYDLESIKRSFKEEGDRFKKRMKDIADEYSNPATHDKWRHRGEDLMDSLRPTVSRAGTIISKVALSVALFFTSVLFVVLLVAIFSNVATIHIGDSLPFELSAWELAGMFTESAGETNLLLIGIGLVALTPLFMLLFGIIKALFGIRRRTRFVGYAAATLFWAGVLVCGLETYRIYQRLDEKEKVVDIIDIAQPKNDTLYVESRLPMGTSNMPEIEFGEGDYLANTDPIRMWPEARINIVPSENNKYYIKLEKMARGKNSAEAGGFAENIHLAYEVQDSSKLIVDRFATLPENEKFRGQRVTVVLAVPEGKYVALGHSTRKAIMRSNNLQDIRPKKMAGNVWKMENAGLSCTTCPKKDKNDDENYEDYY